MLLYNKEDRDLYNLDNLIIIYIEDTSIRAFTTSGNEITIVNCDSTKMAETVIEAIYRKTTFGLENIILDLDDYRTETAKTRKTLRNFQNCNTCIYVDTDGCKEWDNDGFGCDAHTTEEEAKEDGNEEK